MTATKPFPHWIVHDHLQVSGGAERLILTLAQALPDYRFAVCGIYKDFSDGNPGFNLPVVELGKQYVWLPRIARALMTFSLPIRALRDADIIVYSGLYAPLAARFQRRGKRLYYCSTPARFAFDRQQEYLARMPFLLRPLASFFIGCYRRMFLAAMQRMDRVATNSLHMQRRLKEQLGIEARVIYPPIATRLFTWDGQGDYYLSLGRLEPNKRVEHVVRAFLQMPDKQLIVTSGGSQYEFLRTLVADAPNIRFTHWISDTELARLVSRAIACIYIPRDEDFGMSPVEAMAAGKPVIGVAEGGLKETILHQQTGVLLPPDPIEEHIMQAVKQLDAPTALAMRDACEMRARTFSSERFLEQMREFIAD